MTNSYVAQAVAAERIGRLVLEAERDRSATFTPADGPSAADRLQRVWSWTAEAPRRLRAFVLAGQLGPGYCSTC